MAPMANVVVGVASVPLPSPPTTNSSASPFNSKTQTQTLHLHCSQTNHRKTSFPSSLSSPLRIQGSCYVLACLPPSSESSSSSPSAKPSSSSAPSTRLYVSGQLLLLFFCYYPFHFSHPKHSKFWLLLIKIATFSFLLYGSRSNRLWYC